MLQRSMSVGFGPENSSENREKIQSSKWIAGAGGQDRLPSNDPFAIFW
jgi:hypothetical protein